MAFQSLFVGSMELLTISVWASFCSISRLSIQIKVIFKCSELHNREYWLFVKSSLLDLKIIPVFTKQSTSLGQKLFYH